MKHHKTISKKWLSVEFNYEKFQETTPTTHLNEPDALWLKARKRH